VACSIAGETSSYLWNQEEKEMNQQTRAGNKNKKKSKSDRAQSAKEESTEHKLDKELEMTFPASDPPAIIQPAPDKKSTGSTQ